MFDICSPDIAIDSDMRCASKGKFTMSHFNSHRLRARFIPLAVIALGLLLSNLCVLAQTTISTGSIVGTVTDPTGAVVDGAKIVIRNTATNQEISLTSNSAGAFNSGALVPGTYKVQVTAKGFNGVAETLVVQVGN